ncbi:MAG TPA: HIT domain-containing protein [Nitrososphaerales archaeon]|nr:HIT domain-containing protein [Nitrososphaerales archaeon]
MEFGRRIVNSSSVPSERCVFCKIVQGKEPGNVVFEDDSYIAFLDIAPFSRGHTLVCPKKHGETIWEMDESEIGGLFSTAARISKAVVAAVEADGFRFVQNNGEAANQVVSHVHVHVIPVKMADKGRFTGRKSFTQEELRETAETIKDALRGS